MKRKKLSGMLAVGCLCLFTGGFPVRAASSASYMVTIRPGSLARFSESFLNQYRAAGALVTEKTGSIKIQIPAGGTIPYLPDAGDLVYKDGKEGRYTMNTDWYPKNLTVTGNESLVVKYDALNDAVEYRVRYVDDRSGEDIATPLISQGNEGESYTFYPEKVAGYACDTESRELKLSSKAGDNEVTFRYESTVEPNVNQVVIPGETITETEVVPGDTTIITDGGTRVTEAGGSTSEGTDGAAMGDEGTGQNVVTAGGQTQGQTAGEQETIEENDVPRGRQPENDERGTNRDTQEIEADETPLSNKEGKADKDLKSYVIGGGAVVILAIAGLLFYTRKHRLR